MCFRITASTGSISIAVGAIATLAVLAFQAADIYHVQAFRSPVGQLHPAGSGLDDRVLHGHRDRLLRQVRRHVLARLAGDATTASGCAVLIGLRLALRRLVRRWTRAGPAGTTRRGGWRRRRRANSLVHSLDAQSKSDRALARPVRRPRRGPLAAGLRRACRSSAASTTWSSSRAARASTWCCSRCRSRPRAASCRCSRSCGCCRSTSGLSAHSNKLRFRPRAYSYIGNLPVLDVFDKPITDWDVVMKWLFDKVVGALHAARRCAAHAGDRASRSNSTAAGRSSSSRSATASTTS